jgi:ribosomal protein S18 acetylase RimI-like enzyme
MTSPIVELRLCTRDDHELLHALVTAYHAEDRVPHDARALARVLGPLIDGTAGAIWLIREEQSVLGYVALCFGYSIEFGGRDAFIDEIYVAPSHRGRGIGRTVLERLDAHAAALGVRALHLEVDHHNPAARLYERVGFRSRERYRLMSKPLAT